MPPPCLRREEEEEKLLDVLREPEKGFREGWGRPRRRARREE